VAVAVVDEPLSSRNADAVALGVVVVVLGEPPGKNEPVKYWLSNLPADLLRCIAGTFALEPLLLAPPRQPARRALLVIPSLTPSHRGTAIACRLVNSSEAGGL